MTTGVDSNEKTFHTTFDNEWKFSWDSKTRTKTMGLRHNRLFTVIFTQKKVDHIETDFQNNESCVY